MVSTESVYRGGCPGSNLSLSLWPISSHTEPAEGEFQTNCHRRYTQTVDRTADTIEFLVQYASNRLLS